MGSIFNFVDNGKGRAPAPAWAKKIGKVVSAVFDIDGGSQPVARINPNDTFTDTSASSGNIIMMPDLWKVYNDRKSVYLDIQRMDAEDELVSTALDIVADLAIGNSDARQSYKKEPKRTAFAVYSDNPEVDRILKGLNRRLQMEDTIWQIIRAFYKHGNEFREVIIDKQKMQIKGFKQTISYQIWPKATEHGDKLPGWLVVKDQDVTNQAGQELEEWQIIPFIYGEKQGLLAVSPLASARKNWQRLSKMEDGMAVARLVRAYDKIVHKIPIKAEWTRDEIMSTIKRYKDAISKRKLVSSNGSLSNTENPLDVQTDFYLPDDGSGKGGVTMLSANNAQLGNLNDVLYHREKLVCRLKVPVSYLQLTSATKSHVTGGGMSNSDKSFAYTLQRVQAVVVRGLGRLYDLELMLNGIAPEEGLYTIELDPIIPKDRVEDANIELTYAQAAVYFVEAFGALPPELIADKFMQMNHEQQEIMQKFLDGDSKKVWKSKITAIEAGATAAVNSAKAVLKDRLPGDNQKGNGSGNQNKSRAKRASEQIGKSGGSKQSIDIDSLVDVMQELYSGLADDMRSTGHDIPYLNQADADEIKQNILSRVEQDGELIIN